MWIWQKIIEGGWPFMLPLVILNLIILYFIIRKVIDLFIRIPSSKSKLRYGLPEIMQLATFTLFCGILGQVIGLYQALSGIEKLGNISQSMLAGGLKVSMITTLYGAFIFLFSSLFWFLLNQRYQKLTGKTDQSLT